MRVYLVHVLWFEHGCVPSVVEDEDVWFGQAAAHFVKEVLFLKTQRPFVVQSCKTRRDAMMLEVLVKISCDVARVKVIYQKQYERVIDLSLV